MATVFIASASGVVKVRGSENFDKAGNPKSFTGKADTDDRDKTKTYKLGNYFLTEEEAKPKAAELMTNKIEGLKNQIKVLEELKHNLVS